MINFLDEELCCINEVHLKQGGLKLAVAAMEFGQLRMKPIISDCSSMKSQSKRSCEKWGLLFPCPNTWCLCFMSRTFDFLVLNFSQ